MKKMPREGHLGWKLIKVCNYALSLTCRMNRFSYHLKDIINTYNITHRHYLKSIENVLIQTLIIPFPSQTT